ncbi:PilZ domain-containing protein [Acidobacteria bacterium AH-259-D05]|nr:PilZ domain-containing protein [Acidobacteria bacterium AH-259-D05]
MSYEEQRVFERIDVHFMATIIFEVEGKELRKEVEAKDFSAGGAYLVTDACPNVGDEVKIRLHLKESKAVFESLGTVLRVDQLSEKRCGFAVRFEEIPNLSDMQGHE